MPKLSQTELAVKGILLLRRRMDAAQFLPDEAEAVAALCDYAQRTIKARAAGGRKSKPTSAANGAKGGRPEFPKFLCEMKDGTKKDIFKAKNLSDARRRAAKEWDVRSNELTVTSRPDLLDKYKEPPA